MIEIWLIDDLVFDDLLMIYWWIIDYLWLSDNWLMIRLQLIDDWLLMDRLIDWWLIEDLLMIDWGFIDDFWWLIDDFWWLIEDWLMAYLSLMRWPYHSFDCVLYSLQDPCLFFF